MHSKDADIAASLIVAALDLLHRARAPASVADRLCDALRDLADLGLIETADDDDVRDTL